MLQLVRIELFKIFKRPRTFISFAIIAGFALLIELAMYSDGDKFYDFIKQALQDSVSIEGRVVNGYLITYIILQMLLVNIPLLVALVAADALAGEANLGTLRLLLTKPISRTKLVLSKFIASIGYSFLLLVWLAVIGLSLSLLIFGKGDLVNMKSSEIVIIFQDDIIWRYLLAFCFAAIAMMAVSALALLLSVFADNSIGPIVGTMGIIIILMLVSSFDVPLFVVIRPYLLTTHMLGWKGFFSDPVPYHSILNSALILIAYTAGLVAATVYFFKRKDITS